MATSVGYSREIEKFSKPFCPAIPSHSIPFTHSVRKLFCILQQGAQGAAATAATNVAATAQSCISQGFGQAKNYGTLSPADDGQLPETLTYAWHNVDIFGAVHQPGSNWRQLVNRTRGLFCNERHIPAPRKHLLKNGKTQESPDFPPAPVIHLL